MKRIIQKSILCFAAVSLAATSLRSIAAPPETGIHGQTFLYIYISPVTPTEIAPDVWIGIPGIQLPTASSLKVLSKHSGREVARLTSDANGFYSIALPPGDYLLEPETLMLSPWLSACTASARPIEVTVKANQFTPANVFYFREGFCSIAWTPIQIGTNWHWTIPFGGASSSGNQSFIAVPGTTTLESPTGTRPRTNEGHHQSGITGRVNGGVLTATPTGEGSFVHPNRVRVYTDTFPRELVAEVETEIQGNVLWHFDVNLKPGRYVVTAYYPPAPEEGGWMFSYPVLVTVGKKQFTEAVLSFVPYMPTVPVIPLNAGVTRQ
jgi:hypothetical protein